ncbi:MAG: hypothetical protein AAB372_03165 [Patescibacteria group bacterium]
MRKSIVMLSSLGLVGTIPVFAHEGEESHEEPVNYQNKTDRLGQLPALAGVVIIVVLVVLIAKKFGHKRPPTTPTV